MWCVCMPLALTHTTNPARGWSPPRVTLHEMLQTEFVGLIPPNIRVCLWAIWKKPLTLIHPLLLGKTAQCSPEGEGNSPSVIGLLCSPCVEVVAPRW